MITFWCKLLICNTQKHPRNDLELTGSKVFEVGGIGLLMNLFGLVLFRGGGEMHGHSHGDNGHSHGHSHNDGHSHGHSHGTDDAGDDSHSHGHSHDDTNQNTSNQAWLKLVRITLVKSF